MKRRRKIIWNKKFIEKSIFHLILCFVREEGGNGKVYFSSTNLFLLEDNLFSAFIHSSIHSFLHIFIHFYAVMYICWCMQQCCCESVGGRRYGMVEDDYNGAISCEICMLCDSHMSPLLLLQLDLVAIGLRERAFHCKVEFLKFYFLFLCIWLEYSI